MSPVATLVATSPMTPPRPAVRTEPRSRLSAALVATLGLVAAIAFVGSRDRPAEATIPNSPTMPATKSGPDAKPVRQAGDRYELDLPGGLKIAFAWCPPGTFQMGGKEYDDEKPVHERTIR